MGRVVVMGVEPRQALVAHQHEEADFGEIGRRRRGETGRPVLDGIAAVGRDGFPGLEPGAGQPFGRQALDRVAIDGLEAGWVGHGPSLLTVPQWLRSPPAKYMRLLFPTQDRIPISPLSP